MKKKTIKQLVLIAICFCILLGYQLWDRIRTDTVAPVIQFNDQMPEYSVTANESELLAGITAKDNVDADVSDTLVLESIQMVDPDKRIVSVGIAAFDKSGNVAKAQRQICYIDYVRPRFHLSKPLIFSENSVIDVTKVIAATDVIDGDISNHIRSTIISEGSLTVVGTHDVEFRITNSLGDVVKMTLPVETVNASLFEAKLTLTDYLIYMDVGDSFNPKSYLDTYTLTSTETSLKNGLPNGYSLETVGSVDTQVPGVYSVDYKVFYTNPNSTAAIPKVYTGYSKLIVVVEG